MNRWNLYITQGVSGGSRLSLNQKQFSDLSWQSNISINLIGYTNVGKNEHLLELNKLATDYLLKEDRLQE